MAKVFPPFGHLNLESLAIPKLVIFARLCPLIRAATNRASDLFRLPSKQTNSEMELKDAGKYNVFSWRRQRPVSLSASQTHKKKREKVTSPKVKRREAFGSIIYRHLKTNLLRTSNIILKSR